MNNMNEINNTGLKLGALFGCIFLSVAFFSVMLYFIFSVEGVMVDSEVEVAIPLWTEIVLLAVAWVLGGFVFGIFVHLTKAWTLAELAAQTQAVSIAEHGIYLFQARIKDLKKGDKKNED